jgi:pilus assembly protein CpaC
MPVGLLMIVTPRLVRPVRAGSLRGPTDRVQQPNEADLFLLGRTDTGVAPVQEMGRPAPAPAPAPAPPPAGGSAANKPTGFEKDYGHVL